MRREIEITPADVLRLRALGVRAEPERPKREHLASQDDIIIAALNDRIADLARSERRAWAEARRWRLWGWICAVIAAVSLLSQIIVVVARRGGW
jgi:hypothetical protein